MFLSSGYVLTTFLTTYIAEGNRPKSEAQKHMMFLVQASTFLCFQARRSSATRSSASDLTVMSQSATVYCLFVCSLFLVRDSTKLPGHFVLSLMSCGQLANFRIKHVSLCVNRFRVDHPRKKVLNLKGAFQSTRLA